MTEREIAALRAGGLPQAWRGRDRFAILAAGPGSVDLFLAAWQAWRDDPERCGRFHCIAVEPALPTPGFAHLRRAEEPGALVRELADRWPPPTRNLHRIAFEDGRVQLLLAVGAPANRLREIIARVDAFVVSATADEPDPLAETPRLANAFGRLAAPGALLATDSTDPAVPGALRAAGFAIDSTAEDAGGWIRTRHLPPFVRQPMVGRAAPPAPPDRHALIVGAGLAGCAAAWALAEHGWRSTVVERHSALAAEASGNPAGLFHGIVNGQDGTHARFNRAAAIEAGNAIRTAIDGHGIAGETRGLLQLVDPPRDLGSMRALLERLELPGTYVQALDADAAGALAGLRLSRPAWFYPGGGWVDPGGLARAFVGRAGPAVELRCGVEVARLRRDAGVWLILDAAGATITSAAVVVLANAGDALRLLGGAWPIEPVRGQVSMLPAAGLVLPRLPLAGAGFLLPESAGRLVFGATADPDDADPSVRLADHRRNLAQLARLAPALATAVEETRLEGRTAWRWTSRDRLPLIGPVPVSLSESVPRGAPAARLDQARFVERIPGLFVYTALGSRGITWAALGAQVLASTITGAPSPIEAALLDAVDPARFIVRAARLAARGPR